MGFKTLDTLNARIAKQRFHEWFHRHDKRVVYIDVDTLFFSEAVEPVREIARDYDTYVVAPLPWDNPGSVCDKIDRIKSLFGDLFQDRVIFTGQKGLLRGDFLIESESKLDSIDLNYGACDFQGMRLYLRSQIYPGWDSLVKIMRQEFEGEKSL